MALLALLLVTSLLGISEAKVQLDLYYESLCPDSKAFVTQQLYPVYDELGHYIDLGLKPFGKANFKRDEDHGYVFECQHGPDECQGNMYQACLIDFLGDERQVEQMEAVNCIMSDAKPHEATQKCMKKAGLTKDPSYDDVNKCVQGGQGALLLHALGVETKALVPKLYFVPWVVFNGKWNEGDQEGSLVGLRELLCSKYLSDKDECKNN